MLSAQAAMLRFPALLQMFLRLFAQYARMLEHNARAGIVSEEAGPKFLRGHAQADRLPHERDRAIADPAVGSNAPQMPDDSFVQPAQLAGRELVVIHPAALELDDLHHAVRAERKELGHLSSTVIIDIGIGIAVEAEMPLQGLSVFEGGHIRIGPILEK